jgi:hypothetical protein
MTPLVVLGALALGPVVLLTLLRVNAAFIFLSVCLGDVLVQFVSDDAMTVVGGTGATHMVSNNIVKLFLLLLPPVLTLLFMVKTLKPSWLLFNLLPAIGVGLLITLLVVPLTSPGLEHNLVASSLWGDLQKSQDLIVGFSALVCLLFLWRQRPKSAGKEHSKH